uniref:PHD-type domain-containing protein n=1 Tax=Amphimedon queenslandica TaxID=400682 RepID=A0A1X7US45_AMPQE
MLDSEGFVTAGLVHDLLLHSFDVSYLRKFVIKAMVDHSQQSSCTPLLPWVVIEEDGSVAPAHCTCMAGWGCDHEKEALTMFESIANENHIDLIVKANGLFIDLCHPYIGASPNGIVSCSCCGKGVPEVKCPHSVKKSFPEDSKHSFCMEKGSDGNWTLKREHSYYYQVQTQMHACNLEYCDFIVWSESDGKLIDRVYRDNDFFDNIINDLQHLFVNGVLPEVVGKWYLRKQAANSSNALVAPDPLPYEDDEDNEDYNKVCCYCNQPSDGDIILCDKSCHIKWFHCNCLRMRKVPKGIWKCLSCRRYPSLKNYSQTQQTN